MPHSYFHSCHLPSQKQQFPCLMLKCARICRASTSLRSGTCTVPWHGGKLEVGIVFTTSISSQLLGHPKSQKHFAIHVNSSDVSSFLPNLLYLDVSKNRGTPKSSILIGFSLINHPFWDTPIFGNTHFLFFNINKGCSTSRKTASRS